MLVLKQQLKEARIPQAVVARAVAVSEATLAQIVNHNEWPRTSPEEVRQRLASYLESQGIDTAKSFDAVQGAVTPSTAGTTDKTNLSEEENMLLKKQVLFPATKKAFGLFRDPFADETMQGAEDVFTTPDIRYVREALYQTARHGGFMAVIGESGAGKSTLRRDLIERINRENAPVVVIEPYIIAMEDNDVKGKTLKAAANNTANLLAKLNSRDTSMALAKIKYNGKGIDLPGSLAHAKEKGINSVDAFVGIVDKVVSGDKKYQELQNQLRNTKGGERAQILESMAKILEGSSVGKVIADQQALKALIGYRANRDYAKDVVNKSNEQRNLNAGESAGDINFSVMSNANDVKAEQFNNAKDFAEMDAIKPLSDILGTLSKNLTDYSKEYPGLTTAVVGATDGIKAMGAAAAAFAGLRFLMGGGGAGPAGNGGIIAPGTLGKMAGNSIAVPLLYITAGSVAISTVRDALREDFAKKNMSEKVDSISTGTSGYSFVDLAWSVVKDRFSKKGSSISVPSNITTADVNPFNAQANNLAGFGVPSYLSAGQQGQKNQPIQVTTKLEVDGRVLAEIVNDHNGTQAVRGPTGSPQ